MSEERDMDATEVILPPVDTEALRIIVKRKEELVLTINLADLANGEVSVFLQVESGKYYMGTLSLTGKTNNPWSGVCFVTPKTASIW